MEIKQTETIAIIKIPKEKVAPDSFVVRNKGNCMNSDQSAIRIKDGDFILCHPINIEESVGKVVVFKTPIDYFTKQVIKLTKKYLVVCCFVPYRMNAFIPISEVEAIYSVDEVIEKPEIWETKAIK